jgi:hypothetical protein
MTIEQKEVMLFVALLLLFACVIVAAAGNAQDLSNPPTPLLAITNDSIGGEHLYLTPQPIALVPVIVLPADWWAWDRDAWSAPQDSEQKFSRRWDRPSDQFWWYEYPWVKRDSILEIPERRKRK